MAEFRIVWMFQAAGKVIEAPNKNTLKAHDLQAAVRELAESDWGDGWLADPIAVTVQKERPND